MKPAEHILRRLLLACLPLVLVCIFAWQSVAAVSGASGISVAQVQDHVWKHKTTPSGHLQSFPIKGEKKDLHLSQRFKYKAKCFYGTLGTPTILAETATIPEVLHSASLYENPLVRPGYYTFLFRYKPF